MKKYPFISVETDKLVLIDQHNIINDLYYLKIKLPLENQVKTSKYFKKNGYTKGIKKIKKKYIKIK